jgi:hypothetical protein
MWTVEVLNVTVGVDRNLQLPKASPFCPSSIRLIFHVRLLSVFMISVCHEGEYKDYSLMGRNTT